MSSIMQYNGAAVIAMAGKDCIAIASDRRYGIRNQTVGCEMQKVFQMSDKVMVGLTGLATDQQTLLQKFRFRANMYRLREVRHTDAPPAAPALPLSRTEHRFAPSCPVIAFRRVDCQHARHRCQ